MQKNELEELARRARQLRHSLRSCLPVPKPQKVVDLAFPPAMILRRERIDAGIDADVANKKLRTLDKVRYLISGSTAEAACRGCHRRAPSPCDMWPSAVLKCRVRSILSSPRQVCGLGARGAYPWQTSPGRG